MEKDIKCRDVAIKYLTNYDRTEAEVVKKLCSLEYAVEDIEDCMIFLKEFNYINDFEYCAKYMRKHLLAKGKGLVGIRYELKEKGISRDVINNSIEEFISDNDIPTEKERAEGIIKKFFEGCEPTEKLISKAARKLNSMGYDADSIYSAIKILRTKGFSEYEL